MQRQVMCYPDCGGSPCRISTDLGLSIPRFLGRYIKGFMDNMQYAEELLREFLVFRGFTNTLQSFEKELSTDIGRNFQVDKILDLVFSVVHFYIVKIGSVNSSALHHWTPWFVIPYIKSPSLDPQFRVYFSKEWFDALHLSFRNFLSEVFNGTHILKVISTEKNTVKYLKDGIKQLNNKLSQLQALLETKEAEILYLQSLAPSDREASILKEINSISDLSSEASSKDDGVSSRVKDFREPVNDSLHIGEKITAANCGESSSSTGVLDISTVAKSSSMAGSVGQSPSEHEKSSNVLQMAHTENSIDVLGEEEFPEVKVDFQETFLGHTSRISRCRFSASGMNIASASVDGTVRIWTYDSSTPTSRNATIYCGAEIMSLDWECRSDRLLLIGTADGGIKAWNVDAKRVVCDLSTTTEFPSVLDLKCSPVEPIFVSAAASRWNGFHKLDRAGFASLTVWNMKTWKAMTVLPLGEDPPAITSLCFNHNGKILAASAADGMIHMFDMSAGLQITGWPAHDTAVSSLLFGPDETSIFSLGSDGKIFEWSLQNQGRVLWSRDCTRYCFPESLKICRHEIALDSNGKRLLVTSGSVRSPIYQVQGHTLGLRTLPHSGAITSVDWHPTLPIFITGSADHSVRVTSII
ncbi:hypothetical protein OPV22_001198 [Ensete ventricosum]|uniref:Anaphase-promoting complex subunit 4 WD40 domain-containing protein n=1 Tax=Ensete ventricosum TaxID=4639 RepID=A0AAV8RVC2_ENSVE|nr:hypothetical protein OPV22_001198 [Ensete ventricosum]